MHTHILYLYVIVSPNYPNVSQRSFSEENNLPVWIRPHVDTRWMNSVFRVTSTTAKRGGGSFPNSKPMGETGCGQLRYGAPPSSGNFPPQMMGGLADHRGSSLSLGDAPPNLRVSWP